MRDTGSPEKIVLSSSTQCSEHYTVDYSTIPVTFFLEVITGEDVSRTLPQSPVPGSSRGVPGVLEDQVGPSDPAAPRVRLSPADLATRPDPRLPVRQVKTPQRMKTPGWGVKMLDQRGSYLRSSGANDARLPLVDICNTRGKQSNNGSAVCLKGL